jgi:hypothetical protein
MGIGGVACPKPRPSLLDQRDRKAEIATLDRQESEKARIRANGRCEIFIVGEGRCKRRDLHTHHLISGWGKRARGNSALAENKLRVCALHHTELHGHVLVPEGPIQDHAYRRIG